MTKKGQARMTFALPQSSTGGDKKSSVSVGVEHPTRAHKGSGGLVGQRLRSTTLIYAPSCHPQWAHQVHHKNLTDGHTHENIWATEEMMRG
jgi:hypothetical protein